MVELEPADATAAILGSDATQQRLQLILKAKTDVDAARESLAAEQAQANRTLAQGRAALIDAQKLHDEAVVMKAAVEEHESRVGGVATALQNEKDKFEKVRQAVDGQHRAKIAELEVREKKVSDTEAGFAAREALIGPREEAVRKREDEASRIHARIREFTASLSVAS